MLRAILISSIIINLGLLLGRFSGFIREAFVAASFGASFEADIVVLMLTVPDLMVSLLMGGAMGVILVPAFSQNPEAARKLLYQSGVIFGLLFSILVAGMYWQVQALTTLLAPGFDLGQIEQAAEVLKFVLWLIPLTVLAGTTTAYLHYQNKFITASLGALIVNCTIIAGLYLVFIGRGSFETLAVFVLLGGLLRFASQVSVIRPSYHPIKSFRPNLLSKSIIVQYCQAMLSGSLLFMFPVVARAVASFEEVGSIAILHYSMRLIELPLAIFISFVAIVLFPRLAQSFKTDHELHRCYIRYGVQATLALSIVISIVLVMLVDEYSMFVYGYGDMSESNVARISYLVSIGLLVLPLKGLAVYNIAVFNSRANTRTPMLINGAGLLLLLGLLKFEILGSGLEGIIWGWIVSFALICILQLVFLKVEKLKIREIFLKKEFLLGGICAVVLAVYLSQWIATLVLDSWVKLLLGSIGAFLCLIVMTLFYAEFRSALNIQKSSR